MPERTVMLAHHQLQSGPAPNDVSLRSGTLRLLLLLLATLYGITVYLTALSGNHYVAPHASFLPIASALYFIALSLIAITARTYYWAVLPMIIIGVPNAINDLFPSVLMGSPDAAVEPPAFALFTHIDLFLLLGLLRYGHFTLSRQLLSAVFSILFVTVVIATNYLTEAWSADGVYGLYQLRYAFLIYFVFKEVGFHNARRPFVLGLIAAVSMTFLETLVFSSLVAPPGHLLSGNFGKNPLGHFSAAMLCFFLFYRTPRSVLLYKYFPIGVTALLMLGSGTRFSIVAALISVLLIHSIRSSTLLKNVSYALVGTLAILALLLVTPQGKSIVEGITQISENISTPDFIERTPESSSMVTRLHVWLNTAEMASAHWLVGVGPGNWSFLKNDFHIPYDALLDPHNDLLNFIVSYGVPFGLLFYAAVLCYPVAAGYRAAFHRNDHFLQGCQAFILCLTFTGLTNATLWKHSVFALACIFACLLIFSRQEQPIK